jgi:hypothetical protein
MSIVEHLFIYRIMKQPMVKLPGPLDEHDAAHLAELFAVFSDTSRIRILSVLVAGESHVAWPRRSA